MIESVYQAGSFLDWIDEGNAGEQQEGTIVSNTINMNLNTMMTDDSNSEDDNNNRENAAYKRQRRSVSRIKFTEVEDDFLIKLVSKYGEKNWKKVAKEMKGRTVRQCRDRYFHYLSPEIKQEWTPEEEEKLIELVEKFGNRWKVFEKQFPGRTEIQIRNKHYNLLRRKEAIEEQRQSCLFYCNTTNDEANKKCMNIENRESNKDGTTDNTCIDIEDTKLDYLIDSEENNGEFFGEGIECEGFYDFLIY